MMLLRFASTLSLGVLTALLWSPGFALACSVCQAGTSDNRFEFIATTALLTFLPLILIGGGVWGLRRRYLALANQPAPDESTPRIPVAPPSAE